MGAAVAIDREGCDVAKAANPGARIGQNLRAVREAALLSRPVLASRAGVSVATIDHIERGITPRPRRTTLEKIAGPLRVTVDDLIGGATLPTSPPLTLAAMWRASEADRQRALEAASEDEVARYLSDVDGQLDWAEQTLRGPEGEGPDNRKGLRLYMRHLWRLRDEADPDDEPPPSPDEMPALVGSASAAEE
jgi:transcriptional regulator with XRE-family HTH domain